MSLLCLCVLSLSVYDLTCLPCLTLPLPLCGMFLLCLSVLSLSSLCLCLNLSSLSAAISFPLRYVPQRLSVSVSLLNCCLPHFLPLCCMSLCVSLYLSVSVLTCLPCLTQSLVSVSVSVLSASLSVSECVHMCCTCLCCYELLLLFSVCVREGAGV